MEWLILSLKWSEGSEDLVWYKPESCGYTTDLEQAGRFEEAEALSREDPDVTLAVPLTTALALSRKIVLVEASEAAVSEFRKARDRWAENRKKPEWVAKSKRRRAAR